jgi:hypothetical protein
MACDGSRGANNMKRILSLIILSAGTINLTACALVYTAEPMEARVVEAGTQKPLAGVVVVAHWQLVQGTMVGSNLGGQLEVMEAVTDPEGRFGFPGFGPKTALGGQYLDDQDPELIFFKPGYEYRTLRNEYQGDSPTFSIVHRSQWNGKTIEMTVFKGSMESKEALRVYASQFSVLHTAIESILRNSDECNWRKMPRLMLAIFELEHDFRSHGVYSPLYSVNNLSERACGSPTTFFREFKP